MPNSKRLGAKSKRFRGYSHAQLTLLGLYASVGRWEWHEYMFDGTSPYEIEKRWAQGVGGVGGASRSSIYEWSKRLADDGLLDATPFSLAQQAFAERESERRVQEKSTRKKRLPEPDPDVDLVEPAVGGSVTIYTITKRGSQLLEEWLESPCSVPAIEDEAAARLSAGLRSRKELLVGLQQMRPELLTLARRLEETAASRRIQGEPVLELEFDLYRSLTDARLKWLARAEKILKNDLLKRERVAREAEKGTLAERQRIR